MLAPVKKETLETLKQILGVELSAVQVMRVYLALEVQ